MGPENLEGHSVFFMTLVSPLLLDDEPPFLLDDGQLCSPQASAGKGSGSAQQAARPYLCTGVTCHRWCTLRSVFSPSSPSDGFEDYGPDCDSMRVTAFLDIPGQDNLPPLTRLGKYAFGDNVFNR